MFHVNISVGEADSSVKRGSVKTVYGKAFILNCTALDAFRVALTELILSQSTDHCNS